LGDVKYNCEKSLLDRIYYVFVILNGSDDSQSSVPEKGQIDIYESDKKVLINKNNSFGCQYNKNEKGSYIFYTKSDNFKLLKHKVTSE
jgi:hypothetical protein